MKGHDDRLGIAVDGAKGLVVAFVHIDDLRGVRRQFLDVHTCAETFALGSDNDDAIANQPALSKALTGGRSRIISAIPFSMVVKKGLLMVCSCMLGFAGSQRE